ncbi:sigma 54-interacting transcriptional regulator [Alkalicella caledoniensis]|uniref:Sigma 54-interacting transcriptional regulator n=1 Tax=Alkalicella caledoniensis TaxID=2731377 RepID=A0A7G9WAV0_ALKCA|nr:sigma 54-interacting transcriptional regulator [Alkalicella caledoniensis]QNO15812.1 sigma 54-interacting transcriptional regulator [Alkalicella caledoniensis]
MINIEKLKSITTTLGTRNNSKVLEEEIYYNTAKNFGTRLNITSFDMLTEKMSELGIGQVRITLISDSKIIVQLHECFTCGEMEYRGESICYFEGGILAGAISSILGRNMDAVETNCHALGDNYCEFKVTPEKIQETDLDINKKDDNMVNLALHSLRLAKNYSRVEHKTKEFHYKNQRLNQALKRALEINNSNKTILDNMPNFLAMIDNNGVVIKINKQYSEFLKTSSSEIENKNVNTLGWKSKYKDVLNNGNSEIWQEQIGKEEFIIFESPVTEGNGVLRQLIPTDSEFVKLMFDKISFLEREMKYYKNKAVAKSSETTSIDDLSVSSQSMKEVIPYMKKVSKTDATVLLRGESGTGKTMFAKAIHKESHRKNSPFICIDCTTIPENFFEAELFGYEPGAFTGANKNGKIGKLELAHGGTVFLDEIGEIPLETQAKLLRFLQEKEFERIGAISTKKVDVRIIAATNQDLEVMISNGKFRKDLYYRLNVININLPPLRERLEEIPALVDKILLDFCKEVGLNIKEFQEQGLKELIHYHWPGNIRELENLVKRLAINSEHSTITKEEVVKEIQKTKKNVNLGINNPVTDLKELTEKDQILKVLEEHNFNKTSAADELGITRQTLYNKIKRYEIEC